MINALQPADGFPNQPRSPDGDSKPDTSEQSEQDFFGEYIPVAKREFKGYEKSPDSRTWASENHNKGFYSLVLATASLSFELLKLFFEKDSLVFKGISAAKEVSLRVRGRLQYDLYSKDNDDLGYDKKYRPSAANIGGIACFLEREVNPILEID